ncbi:MAG: hypothetical protein ACTHM1_12025 [Solirubrobacteraceae bacterium]
MNKLLSNIAAVLFALAAVGLVAPTLSKLIPVAVVLFVLVVIARVVWFFTR